MAVKWDTSYEQSVTPQRRWATVTVAKVPDTLLKEIVRGKGKGIEPTVVDAVYGRIAAALERKGQLILYGPPGTGKTWRARRFAVWWLMKQIGRKGADAVLGDSERLRPAERELSTFQHADSGATAGVGLLTRVTFHPSYSYEDFIEGFRPDGGGAGGLSLALDDGVFKRVCRAAGANPGRPYLLLIDEINRGNVAKIVGIGLPVAALLKELTAGAGEMPLCDALAAVVEQSLGNSAGRAATTSGTVFST